MNEIKPVSNNACRKISKSCTYSHYLINVCNILVSLKYLWKEDPLKLDIYFWANRKLFPHEFVPLTTVLTFPLLVDWVAVCHGWKKGFSSLRQILQDLQLLWTLGQPRLCHLFQKAWWLCQILSETRPPQHRDKKLIVPNGVTPIKNFMVLWFFRICLGSCSKVCRSFDEGFGAVYDAPASWIHFLKSCW